MRLRRSDPAQPGLRRVRRGKGFAVVDADGRPVDADTKDRVASLVIPPAWQDVWVCPWPNGHIQAVGTDAAGRRQYLYHPAWHETRDRAKHERVLTLARRLPEARAEIARRLRRSGLGRERVGAVALRLLDAGLFRTGGEEYENENGSHGVATLRKDHVSVRGDVVSFCFPAKSGVEREAEVRDALLAKAVTTLKRSRGPSERLLQYRTDAGEWCELTSTEINKDFKELVGEDYTVKDLRTWAGTLLAAAAFAERADGGPPASERARKKVERDVMTVVSEHLGNTPAVARRSYVDSRVVDEYAAGRTIARALARASAADRRRLRRGDLAEVTGRAALERALVRLLS
ncbi:DNA topoisomerase IB [Intrasporangium calvum]|uniref:DNA topoisomerase n=1 Tax=Intrasporangium calvum TaxID=53358 RepID=A0ABT5GJU3_9MICO|nr:DNA topoisomerase IB [Intrasporangium calvum]MDC5698276.1 DNA topoisomerase IB [Intrasporangium calvum]